jgi:hypothetical protein
MFFSGKYSKLPDKWNKFCGTRMILTNIKMKPKTILSSALLILTNLTFILIILGTSWSCSKEPVFKESLIKVDSINVEYFPTLLYPGDLFSVNLHGTISSNGCSSLSYCKFYIQNQDLIIEAWKKTEVSAGVCPAVMVYLNQSLIFSEKHLPENFTIKVKQPDGSYLEKQIN